ncbi:MAG: septum formation protein Maf [Deltaproteobacteria bacterium]|nr:septum formation protein Maf [Deltaproteobacteria bacterium]
MKFLLGSSSPRRKQLVQKIFEDLKIPVSLAFLSPDINEDPFANEDPLSYVQRIAFDKMQTLAQLPGFFAPALCADTTVCIGQSILGKPVDAQDATKMLEQLSGATHTVATSCVLSLENKANFDQNDFQKHFPAVKITKNPSATHKITIFQFTSLTKVSFKELSAEEIQNYVATGQPMDKAGAYGLQGDAQNFVTQIEGSSHNVIGLPTEDLGGVLQWFVANHIIN